MADERRTRQRAESSGDDGRQAGPSRQRASVKKLVQAAVEQLVGLVDRPVHGIVGFERTDDGCLVEVEVVELERVPDTMTILAAYEVEVDTAGELLGYRRLRRYARSQVNEAER